MHTKKLLVGLLAAFSASAAYAGGTVAPAPAEAPAAPAYAPAPQAYAPAPVVVAPVWAPHAYVGASIGRSDYSGSTPLTVGAGGVVTSTSYPGSATGGKIFAGYQFSPNWAAEIAYVNLGSSAGIRGQGGAIDLLGSIPFGNGWGLFGKIGVADMKANGAWDDGNKAGANYGIGVNYNWTHSLGLRAEAERFQKVGNDLSANLYSIGLQYNF